MNTKINTALVNARKKAGFTQAEVANRVGLTEAGYQNYERGRHLPNVQTAKLIAQALNSTVEDLF